MDVYMWWVSKPWTIDDTQRDRDETPWRIDRSLPSTQPIKHPPPTSRHPPIYPPPFHLRKHLLAQLRPRPWPPRPAPPVLPIPPRRRRRRRLPLPPRRRRGRLLLLPLPLHPLPRRRRRRPRRRARRGGRSGVVGADKRHPQDQRGGEPVGEAEARHLEGAGILQRALAQGAQRHQHARVLYRLALWGGWVGGLGCGRPGVGKRRFMHHGVTRVFIT